MTIYLTSDHHLQHGNIIEYTNRPFDDVSEMDSVLMERWNEIVTPEDTVLFGGDLTLQGKTVAADMLDELHGDIVFLRGNHDKVDAVIPQSSRDAVRVRHMIRFTYGEYVFYYTHWPQNLPQTGDDVWGIHGHVHDDEDYPFIDIENQRINVCVEKTGYRPVSIEDIVSYIEAGKTISSTYDE